MPSHWPLRDIVDRAAELRRLLDEVAEIPWNHPAWWFAVHASAALDRRAESSLDRTTQRAADFLNSDGRPASDTLMAARTRRSHALPERVARAVVAARAAAHALRELDGTLPEQPLLCRLSRRGTVWVRTELPEAPLQAAFTFGGRAFLAPVEGTTEPALVTAIIERMTDRPQGLLRSTAELGGESTPAAITISIDDEQLATARHLHRRGWTAQGGPWLGIGTTEEEQVVSCSHMVVDGYGHAVLSDRIIASIERANAERRLAHLTEIARFALRGTAPEWPEPRLVGGANVLGLATATLAAMPPFAAASYALGRTLERIYRANLPPDARAAHRFAPTFQVPIAPGDASDPLRRRRRVLPSLLSVRMFQGAFEPYAEFARRLPLHLERARAGRGALARMLAAVQHIPLPLTAKRHLVRPRSEPSRLIPLAEVLAGRGCLSFLRFPAEDLPARPLYAISSPGLTANSRDSMGASVLTLIDSAQGAQVTVSGSGLAGNDYGAANILELWREELARVRKSARFEKRVRR